VGPESLTGIALIAVPVLLSLTLHEYGHARVALAFGDDTAKRAGRITLNPLAHLDLLGTLCFLFGPVGWAKPVPVTPHYLRPARAGDVAVSLAGVGMNVLLALLASAGLIFMTFLGARVDYNPAAPPTVVGVVAFMLVYLIQINLCLIVFNLIPLYPLDGHHVLREMLPARMHGRFMDWQRHFGRYALLALLVIPWAVRLLRIGVHFNPIGRLLWLVIDQVMPMMLPGQTAALAADAWAHYAPYLPY
jgi:Zn-dependent protease